jgi:hypothetical protein
MKLASVFLIDIWSFALSFIKKKGADPVLETPT